jgi:hypothetical protein
MNTTKKIARFFIYVIVILVQLMMTQVVTFLVTLFIPYSEDFAQTHAVLMNAIFGLSFAIGVFWPGWLAIRRRWLPLAPRHLARFLGALVGAYIPLLVALLIYRGFEPGNPFFLFSVLGSVLGFYMLGWDEKKEKS